MEQDKLLTIQQVADYLQVGRGQVYKFFKHKSNPLHYIYIMKNRRRIQKPDLEKWISNGGQHA